MQFTRIELKANEAYYLVLEGCAPFAFMEGKLELDVFNKHDISMEHQDILEPQEYADKYVPSKLGLIFSERIFTADQTTFASFSCQLAKNEHFQSNPKDKKQG